MTPNTRRLNDGAPTPAPGARPPPGPLPIPRMTRVLWHPLFAGGLLAADLGWHLVAPFSTFSYAAVGVMTIWFGLTLVNRLTGGAVLAWANRRTRGRGGG
jgi:hypothetical protein